MRRVKVIGHCVILCVISFLSGMWVAEQGAQKECEPAVNIGAWHRSMKGWEADDIVR